MSNKSSKVACMDVHGLMLVALWMVISLNLIQPHYRGSWYPSGCTNCANFTNELQNSFNIDCWWELTTTDWSLMIDALRSGTPYLGFCFNLDHKEALQKACVETNHRVYA